MKHFIKNYSTKIFKKILIALLFEIFAKISFACTNIIVTPGATIDGSCIITYSADSHILYGELHYIPAGTHSDTAYIKIYEWDTGKYLGKIKQVRNTYAVVGHMNEYQVSITETTFGGRPELQDTTAVLDYGNLMFIALQRAKTAREAIHVIANLIKEYGYYSTGETFSIADPNEAWIMEIIGKGVKMGYQGKGNNKKMVNLNKGAVWVALRVPDGYVCAHANQSRIRKFPLNDTLNCLYSPDVISFAREMKYFNGKDEDFSFADAYAPIDFEGARFCEARVWSIFRRIDSSIYKYIDFASGENLKNVLPLWIKPEKKLSLHDVMELMRDYFQDSPFDLTMDIGAGPYRCPVRWRPLTWKIDSIEGFNERAISTQQTGFSVVAQMRSWLPRQIGGILWFGVDDTYMTVYTPFYCSITEIPIYFAPNNGSITRFSETSAFWIFNQVSNLAYTRFSLMIPEIRKRQNEIESFYISLISLFDKFAEEKLKINSDVTIKLLNEFCNSLATYTFNEWKKLYQYLFVKYLDGNIKIPTNNEKYPKVIHPGYPEEWYKLILEKTGNKFILKK